MLTTASSAGKQDSSKVATTDNWSLTDFNASLEDCFKADTAGVSVASFVVFLLLSDGGHIADITFSTIGIALVSALANAAMPELPLIEVVDRITSEQVSSMMSCD